MKRRCVGSGDRRGKLPRVQSVNFEQKKRKDLTFVMSNLVKISPVILLTLSGTTLIKIDIAHFIKTQGRLWSLVSHYVIIFTDKLKKGLNFKPDEFHKDLLNKHLKGYSATVRLCCHSLGKLNATWNIIIR